SDGSVSARFALSDEVATPPLFAGQQLVVATRDGVVAALAWPQGQRTWTRDDVDAVGLARLGSDLVVTCRDGRLERWDADGRPRWRFDAGRGLATAACLHRGHAFVFDEDGWLHAVDLVRGVRRFKVEVGPSVAAPVAVDGVLLLTARSGEVHAFDARSHEVRWSYDLEGELWAPPAVALGHVFVASWGERLHALTLKSGDDAWSVDLPAPVTAPPVVAAGIVYVATEGGELLAFDAAGGRDAGRHQVSHAPIQAGPLPIGDALVVAAIDGTVHCLQ
ncbi:MAG: PQQ-like beta-propeller repeat protein, partial [Nocardiopsis sp. BM-2018]